MRESIFANIPFFLLLVALSFLTLGADRIGLLQPAKGALGFVSVPIQLAIYQSSTNVQTEIGTFLQIRKIVQDYSKLQDEYAKVVAELVRLEAVQEENKILRAQFEGQPAKVKSLLPARVIGLSKNLLVDKGSNLGVELGQIVTLENSLIGTVIDTAPNFSTVRLLTNHQSSITVYVGDPAGPRGLVSGSFGSTMILEKILPEEKLAVGQLVFTAGEEEAGNIPKSLILGKIAKVNKKETAVFQSAEITPLFPIGELRTVFVNLKL